MTHGYILLSIKACSDDWPLFQELETSLTQEQMGRLGNNLSMYQKEFKVCM